jgi:hypothetical protein
VKQKNPVAISPRRQDAATIVLPCIMEGVCIAGNLLGHMEKVRYLYHNVTDTNKFLEFSRKTYLDIVDIGQFDEPINQPK